MKYFTACLITSPAGALFPGCSAPTGEASVVDPAFLRKSSLSSGL